MLEDVKTTGGPKRSDASVCWCSTYRIPSKENSALVGPARGERVAALMACEPVGTRALFEKAGFRKVADASSVTGGFPRVLMQPELG